MDFSYFENRDCEYYPCHSLKNINCLFCFCPLYTIEDCGGTPEYTKGHDGRFIKDCSSCTFPHIKDNYNKIIAKLKGGSL